MSYLANKLKEKQAKYIRRKTRSNKKVKANTDEVRVVVQKSNKFVSAQAIDKTGAVLASISDKGQKGTCKCCRKRVCKVVEGKKNRNCCFW